MDAHTIAPIVGAFTPCPITLNRVFRNARKGLRFSQAEFADRLGVCRFWYSRLENERLFVPEHAEAVLSLIPKLAKIADLDVEYLASLQLKYSPSNPTAPTFVTYYRERNNA